LPEKDSALLWDMLTTAREVQRLASGRDRSDLEEDAGFRMAIERGLEIIGVAASRVSEELRSAHPEIPWHPIISQRNIIAHQYEDIILELVWGVVTRRIPELIAQLTPLIPEEPA
jgi:uncharacterized protein with HEPN domain